MPSKIIGRVLRRGLFPVALSVASPLRAQVPCPASAGRAVEAGWRAYRADAIRRAENLFAQADRSCSGNLDAKVGLGYTALRLGRLGRSDSLFRLVTSRDTANADAWEGLALVAHRQGREAEAVAALRRVVSLNPANATASGLLERLIPEVRPPRPPVFIPDTLVAQARTRGEHFEVPGTDGWQPFYIKGVNFGVALPGRFPAEFPTDSGLYGAWLDTLAGMHGNTVRLYTILPPEFYRALRGHNVLHPDAPLWLMQGAWAELPPHNDFDDSVWLASFHQELERVAGVIHGAVDLAPRRGHAAGSYDADVSRWTLGYILGREWEPYAVKAFDSTRAGELTAYQGQFLQADGPPMDIWLARQCDYLLTYEASHYHTIRPIAYTNWPTLDPLTHPTEATVEEEERWRKQVGRSLGATTNEFENDVVALDANLVHPTAANPAGWFASYHVYPYYPDFMLYDPGYKKARSPEGPSNYFGYLEDLHRHHQGLPLVIAEYGVPSSRGMAHTQPQGWTHGGHDEQSMAEIDARLTREIRQSGAAGGILFALMDEWFKKNWMVVDLELPADRNRLWLNAEDAEQHYGILGMYAGSADSVPVLGGDPTAWTRGTPLEASTGSLPPFSPRSLYLQSDESAVYLAVVLSGAEGRAFPWDSTHLLLAIDTYQPEHGQHLLPDSLALSNLGFEFLARFDGPEDARLDVLPDYNPYAGPPGPTGDDMGRFYHRPVTIHDRWDGRFDSMYVTMDRARFGRDGTFFPSQGYNRGRLRQGTAEASSLSDWYYDRGAGLLELRLPWMLLNVSDPSSATILYEQAIQPEFGTVRATGFHFGVLAYRPGSRPTASGALPRLRAGRWRVPDFPAWLWKTWQIPHYHEGAKPVIGAMRAVWGEW